MSRSKETPGNISIGGDISKDVSTGDNVSPEIDWMSANADMLAKEYSGKWVAVSGDVLVASGDTEEKMLDKVKELGLDDILVARIPSPDDPEVMMYPVPAAN